LDPLLAATIAAGVLVIAGAVVSFGRGFGRFGGSWWVENDRLKTANRIGTVIGAIIIVGVLGYAWYRRF
jgi:hypothetical protein